MSVKDRDHRLLSRYADGEMGDVERVRLEERLANEPALAAALEAVRSGCGWFAAGREEGVVTPSDGFAQRVVQQARRLPEPAEERGAGEVAEVSVLIRRLMLAALLILGAAIVFSAVLWKRNDPSELQASPGEIQQEMERLDQEIARRRRSGGR